MTRLVQRCREIAGNTPDACATGSIATIPTTYNTIPHTVRFSLDLRHPDDAVLADIIKQFEVACEIERNKGSSVKREELGATPAQTFSPCCVAVVRKAL
jgi:acetylornithine deacetylase/succinyl-diaminopimelate desuccinylase-like protein